MLVLQLFCKVLPKFCIRLAVLGHTDLLSKGLLFVYEDTGPETVNTLLVPSGEKSWKK